FEALTPEKTSALAASPASVLPRQEPGTKPSNALKYELYADGTLSDDGKEFIIKFNCGNRPFGTESLGSGFNVDAAGNYRNNETGKFEPVRTWAFAVRPGDELEYRWPLQSFENGQYHLRVYGPNGFFREFAGTSGAGMEVKCTPMVISGRKPSGELK